MGLGRRKLRHLEFGRAALGGRQDFTITATATAAGLLVACRELGDIVRNIQGRNVNYRSLGLDVRRELKDEWENQERHDAGVQPDRNNLGPAEILVLGPNVFDLDGLACDSLQRGQL